MLGWILSDSRRAERLLALTGLSPTELRAGLGEASTLRALLDFLLDHEPDLLACAEALDVSPKRIVAARAAIG